MDKDIYCIQKLEERFKRSVKLKVSLPVPESLVIFVIFLLSQALVPEYCGQHIHDYVNHRFANLTHKDTFELKFLLVILPPSSQPWN